MSDLFQTIFLRLCLHAGVTIATHLLWLFLGNHIVWSCPDDTLWILIFLANCTTLILCKLNQILERLPGDGEQQDTD